MTTTTPESVVNFADIMALLKAGYDHDKTWQAVCVSLYHYISGFEIGPEVSRALFVLLFYGNIPVKLGLEILNQVIFASPGHLKLEAADLGKMRVAVLNEMYDFVRNMLKVVNVESFQFYLLVMVAANHYHRGLSRRHKVVFVEIADKAKAARNYMAKDAAERLERLVSGDRKSLRASVRR